MTLETQTYKINAFVSILIDGPSLDDNDAITVLSELSDYLLGFTEERLFILGLSVIGLTKAKTTTQDGLTTSIWECGLTAKIQLTRVFLDAGGLRHFRKDIESRLGTRRVFLKVKIEPTPSKRIPDDILRVLEIEDPEEAARAELLLAILGIKLDATNNIMRFSSLD